MKDLFIVILSALPLLGAATCPLCEINNAYNKEHPGDFEYYDDYLKAENKGKDEVKKEQD